MPLPISDKRHVDAAEGWLALGNHLEANEELERITPGLRAHPDVLSLPWEIYVRAGKWTTQLQSQKASPTTFQPTFADGYTFAQRSTSLSEAHPAGIRSGHPTQDRGTCAANAWL